MPFIDDRSLILLNWSGSVESAQTTAHELGHAYHNTQLAHRTPLQKRLPMALAETASIFCETLVVEAGVSTLQVRRVELTGLAPDTVYEFGIGKAPAKETDGWKFRTMPTELSRPVRFVSGGDMMHNREMVDAMNLRAGALDPDFAMLGGDLAYANGVAATRWVDWLQSWMKNSVGKDRRIIPFVIGIGNHEVKGGYNGKIPDDAPFFYSLFATPEGKSSYALDFGKYMSVIALDSGHTQQIAGPQAEWLAAALAKRTAQQFLFAWERRHPAARADHAADGRRTSRQGKK